MAIPAVVRSSQARVAAGQTRAQRLLGAFLARRSPATLRAYRGDLAAFARYLELEDVEAASEWLLSRDVGEANEAALLWQARMIEDGLSPATVNRRITAIRSLTRMGRRIGLIAWAIDVESVPQQRYRDTRGPGADNVRKMIAHVVKTQRGPRRARNLALLALLVDLALRRAEVLGVDLADVDLSARSVWVLRKGKTEKIRKTLTRNAADRLREWIAARGDWQGPLFTAMANGVDDRKRLSPNGLYFFIKRLGNALGIDVRPHGLRHSSVTEGLDRTDGNVRAVQAHAGHSSVATTMTYDDARQDFAGEVAELVSGSFWSGFDAEGLS